MTAEPIIRVPESAESTVQVTKQKLETDQSTVQYSPGTKTGSWLADWVGGESLITL